MKHAICFLTVKPSKLFCDFCEKLKSDMYDVYICVDNNSFNVQLSEKYIVIKEDNLVCEKLGFKNSVTYCKNKACSRDKALYYFSIKDTSYDYV